MSSTKTSLPSATNYTCFIEKPIVLPEDGVISHYVKDKSCLHIFGGGTRNGTTFGVLDCELEEKSQANDRIDKITKAIDLATVGINSNSQVDAYWIKNYIFVIQLEKKNSFHVYSMTHRRWIVDIDTTSNSMGIPQTFVSKYDLNHVSRESRSLLFTNYTATAYLLVITHLSNIYFYSLTSVRRPKLIATRKIENNIMYYQHGMLCVSRSKDCIKILLLGTSSISDKIGFLSTFVELKIEFLHENAFSGCIRNASMFESNVSIQQKVIKNISVVDDRGPTFGVDTRIYNFGCVLFNSTNDDTIIALIGGSSNDGSIIFYNYTKNEVIVVSKVCTVI